MKKLTCLLITVLCILTSALPSIAKPINKGKIHLSVINGSMRDTPPIFLQTSEAYLPGKTSYIASDDAGIPYVINGEKIILELTNAKQLTVPPAVPAISTIGQYKYIACVSASGTAKVTIKVGTTVITSINIDKNASMDQTFTGIYSVGSDSYIIIGSYRVQQKRELLYPSVAQGSTKTPNAILVSISKLEKQGTCRNS